MKKVYHDSVFQSLAGQLLNLIIIWDGLKSAWKSPSISSQTWTIVLCVCCVSTDVLIRYLLSVLPPIMTFWSRLGVCHGMTNPYSKQFISMSNTQLCRHCPIRSFIDVVTMIQSLLPHQSQTSFIRKLVEEKQCRCWIIIKQHVLS